MMLMFGNQTRSLCSAFNNDVNTVQLSVHKIISDVNVGADTDFGMWQHDALKVIPDCIKHRCF